MGSQRKGELDYANLKRWRAATDQATVRRLGWCLATVRVASGKASAPRMCTEASLNSLLASRLTNCFEHVAENSNLVAT
jgi:hypothetical protein